MKPRVWYVNGDHLWTGINKGKDAALDDYAESTTEESKAVKVIKYDDFIECRVPIDWEKVWKSFKRWSAGNHLLGEPDKDIIEQLVERSILGDY